MFIDVMFEAPSSSRPYVCVCSRTFVYDDRKELVWLSGTMDHLRQVTQHGIYAWPSNSFLLTSWKRVVRDVEPLEKHTVVSRTAHLVERMRGSTMQLLLHAQLQTPTYQHAYVSLSLTLIHYFLLRHRRKRYWRKRRQRVRLHRRHHNCGR